MAVFVREQHGSEPKPNCWNIFTMMTRNQRRWTFQAVQDEGEAVSVSRPKSQQRLKAQDDPKGGFGTACFLFRQWSFDSSTSLFLSPFSFSVWPSACDKDPRLEPCVHIPLIVPLQMLASVILFYLLVYIAILMFFSEAVSGGWWNCWFYALCLL